MSQIHAFSYFSPLPIIPNRVPRPSAVCLAGSKLGSIGWVPGGSAVGVRAFAGVEESGRRRRRRSGVVCAAEVFTPQTLHWVSAISSIVLLFTRDVGIQKSLLAPLFALQAPSSVIAWIKSEYGMWTAFLALLVRLFYPLPGEVELPLLTMLIAAVSPTQTTHLRGTPAAAIISLSIAGYLAYQHFSKAAKLEDAFDSRSIVPTLSLLGTLIPPILLLFLY